MTAITDMYFVKVGAYYLSSIPEDRRVSADFVTMKRGEPSLVPNVALAFMYDKELAKDYVAFLEATFENVRIIESTIEFNRLAILN